MNSKRKYEIFAWLFISFLTGFVTYTSYVEYIKPINEYPITSGKLLNVDICESETTAMIRGFPTKINSKVFCFDLGKNKEFHIFKTNRKYNKLLSQLKSGDSIRVSYSDQYDDKTYTTIQIFKDKNLIFSYHDRKQQEKIELIALMAATFIFLIFGIVRHRNYLKIKVANNVYN